MNNQLSKIELDMDIRVIASSWHQANMGHKYKDNAERHSRLLMKRDNFKRFRFWYAIGGITGACATMLLFEFFSVQEQPAAIAAVLMVVLGLTSLFCLGTTLLLTFLLHENAEHIAALEADVNHGRETQRTRIETQENQDEVGKLAYIIQMLSSHLNEYVQKANVNQAASQLGVAPQNSHPILDNLQPAMQNVRDALNTLSLMRTFERDSARLTPHKSHEIKDLARAKNTQLLELASDLNLDIEFREDP